MTFGGCAGLGIPTSLYTCKENNGWPLNLADMLKFA